MFTFVAEFDCADVTLLSDVIVEVTTDSGAVYELNAVWDEEAGCFVASDHITNGLPKNVSARYEYELDAESRDTNKLNEVQLSLEGIKEKTASFRDKDLKMHDTQSAANLLKNQLLDSIDNIPPEMANNPAN